MALTSVESNSKQTKTTFCFFLLFFFFFDKKVLLSICIENQICTLTNKNFGTSFNTAVLKVKFIFELIFSRNRDVNLVKFKYLIQNVSEIKVLEIMSVSYGYTN